MKKNFTPLILEFIKIFEKITDIASIPIFRKYLYKLKVARRRKSQIELSKRVSIGKSPRDLLMMSQY